MRVIFLGSPAFALPSLELVAREHQVLAVVSQPDRPAGRGRKLQPPPVKELALRLGLPVEQPLKVRDGVLTKTLLALQPDVFVVVAYGRILPRISWLCRGWAHGMCMPRCCPSIAAPRLSSGP